MFYEATQFNSDIGRWDVSNVTDMFGMFYRATDFNADICRWNVNNVTDMAYMFSVTTQFNSDISGWDVSRVTTMYNMFREAAMFSADITHWQLYSTTGYNYNHKVDGWKEISMPEDIKDQLKKQDCTCPVLLTTIVGKALRCLVCKYLFSEEMKEWIDRAPSCPHCRSKWQSNVYYKIDKSG
jgi:surface protein